MARIVISGSAGRSVTVGTTPDVQKALREAISSCLFNAAQAIGDPDNSVVKVGDANNSVIAAEDGSDLIAPGAGNSFYASGVDYTIIGSGGSDTLVAGRGNATLVANLGSHPTGADFFVLVEPRNSPGELEAQDKSGVNNTFVLPDNTVISVEGINEHDYMLFRPTKNNAKSSSRKSLRSFRGLPEKLIEDVARSCGASIEDARNALLDLQAKSARTTTRRVTAEAHARHSTKDHEWEPPPYALPTGLEWPREQFDQSSEFGKRGGLVRHLDRVWRPLIAAKAIGMPTLRAFYPSTASAIDDFKYRGIRSGGEARNLPPDLDIPLAQPRTERRRQTGVTPPSPTG
jgi:hypothetical protein